MPAFPADRSQLQPAWLAEMASGLPFSLPGPQRIKQRISHHAPGHLCFLVPSPVTVPHFPCNLPHVSVDVSYMCFPTVSLQLRHPLVLSCLHFSDIAPYVFSLKHLPCFPYMSPFSPYFPMVPYNFLYSPYNSAPRKSQYFFMWSLFLHGSPIPPLWNPPRGLLLEASKTCQSDSIFHGNVFLRCTRDLLVSRWFHKFPISQPCVYICSPCPYSPEICLHPYSLPEWIGKKSLNCSLSTKTVFPLKKREATTHVA